MSRRGQVSLTKPTYPRIVPRCCSVPQAKPSADYEYRISLRPHPVGHPSSSTRDSASRAVPSSIRVKRDGYREAGEWQQAEGDQRDCAAQKVFARAGSRKPRSDQHQECSTTDNHGYGWLGSAGPTTSFVVSARGGSDRWRSAVPARPARPDAEGSGIIVRSASWSDHWSRALSAISRTWRSRNVGEPFIAGMPPFAHSTRLPS
jgi:hypothetical protein